MKQKLKKYEVVDNRLLLCVYLIDEVLSPQEVEKG